MIKEVAIVYLAVCAAAWVVTRLEGLPALGEYVHLLIAAIFLFTAVRLARGRLKHYGLELGGLLTPANDDKPKGPLGLWDLGRAVANAAPSGLIELCVAIGVAAVVFPIFALGFQWWYQPAHPFALTLPPDVVSFALAQLVVIALPEEAFFRGYVQTALGDVEKARIRLLGVEVAPITLVVQALLFALIHVVVQPDPARLAVFFPGLLFGWIRAWRGGIGAAVAFHAMSNLFSDVLSRSWL